jgi:hypothetical protein
MLFTCKKQTVQPGGALDNTAFKPRCEISSYKLRFIVSAVPFLGKYG